MPAPDLIPDLPDQPEAGWAAPQSPDEPAGVGEPVEGGAPSNPDVPLPPPAPVPAPRNRPPGADAGYAKYVDYLEDELSRIATLVRAYAMRRSPTEACAPSPDQAVTQQPFAWDDSVADPNRRRHWHDCREHAEEELRRILRRLSLTDPPLRRQFPLDRLNRLWQFRVAAPDGRTPSSAELDVLLLALLDYRCSRYRAFFRNLATDDGTEPGGLTAGMVVEIVRPDPAVLEDRLAMFHAGARLVDAGLIELGPEIGDNSLWRLQIDPAVAGFLLATSALDPELHDSVQVHREAVGWDELHAAPETVAQLEFFAKQLRQLVPPVVLLLHGPAGSPFVGAVRAVLTAAGAGRLLAADMGRAASRTDWARWVARVYREARLKGAAVLWNGADAILEASRTDARWSELLHSPRDVLTFIATDTAWDPVDASRAVAGTFARIELPIPPVEIRRSLWQALLLREKLMLADATREAALDLLQSFQFSEGQISEAVTIARGLAAAGAREAQPDAAGWLYDACRRVSARGLVSFTHRIQPRPSLVTLDAVVLAGEAKQQLQELNYRIQRMTDIYYGLGFGQKLSLGRGLVALFSGPSGTGKTLAATVLASFNQRDLYKVDLSAVVSKYVGDTEKNLARVFSDAQSANALLFFDEADAIFGKRGEVDKAQDRWANMEVNFLLQRVEEFAGVVILATNLRQNIDEAFLRRVQVLIDFKPPDADLRLKILAAMFPEHVTPPPLADLKAYCKQFDLTGGNLKNIALDAAFRALPDQTAPPLTIRIEHLVLATAREYRKLSRPVTAASFGRNYFEMVKSAKFSFD